MRHRIKEYISRRGPLRLRQGDRFVLPLLRGHLIHRYSDPAKNKKQLYLVDTSAPDATKLRKATGGGGGAPLSSRDGLVLARVAQELRVCNPATGKSVTLPSAPRFGSAYNNIDYVLLVGDHDEGVTAVGRHFHVVMAYLEMLYDCHHPGIHLNLQTFSSEHGVWRRYTEIRANLRGNYLKRNLDTALVVGDDVVHWLCVTNIETYVLKLKVKAAQLKATTPPKSFPHGSEHPKLLATSSVGGDVLVLVAESDKISSWTQSKHTSKWQQRSQVVIETETILQFLDKVGETRPHGKNQFTLVWFAERSGNVLIKMYNYGFFWLNLQSKKIVRCFSDPGAKYSNSTENIPYEMSLMSWVPTFSSTL